MAEKYVYSGALGAGTGADWANAFTNLVAALAAAAAGDNVWVADDHAYAPGAAVQTYLSSGTASNPVRIFCARRTGGSVPPVNADLRTTATETTTGASNQSYQGYAYCYGITFSCANGASSASQGVCNAAGSGWTFDTCALRLGTTSTTARINIGFGATSSTQLGKAIFKNTTFQFGGTSQGIVLRGCDCDWIGGSITGATLPTTFFLNSDIGSALVHIRDVDLSSLGSGKTIFGAFTCAQRIVAERCKLGSSVTVAAAQIMPGVIIDLVNCDSGSTNYRNERYTMQAAETTETTVVMSGGATDGTTPFSHKIVTTANCNAFIPFESMVLAQDWVDSTGSPVSQTFEIVTDNVTLTDQDAWIEYEYLNDPSFPYGTVATTFSGFYATGSNLTSSSVTWTTTGIVTPVKQKIVITFTPQKKGLYRAVLKVAKANTTLYVSPPAAKAA